MNSSSKKAPLNILFLTLQREWFDAIATGKKKEEYRDIKPYFGSRLLTEDGKPRPYDEVHFRNGYAPKAPFMRVKWKGLEYKTFGKNRVFTIKLGKVMETKNWKGPRD